ncbi:MAG TPA: ATP-binding protein [Pyrinomonadaceae bacterium]|nr:ATP-binding protein [Pyrinomonadaceae bacterium]
MNFFKTFRGRLLLILAFLLIATLGVQYYLNLLTQRQNNQLRDAQAKALVAGITLGSNVITSTEYMQDLIDREGQTYVDEDARARIKDVIIIDNNWEVTDSLNPDFVPVTGPKGETVRKKLAELPDLPPLKEGSRLGEDLAHFPNANLEGGDDEARAIPIQTSEGRFYVMVLLRNDESEAARRAAFPLIVTLIVLSLSTLVTFVLVWRFTRPIANLSNAAREVADGNLSVRVPDHGRTDEMGQLAQRFNEMTAELEKAKELEEQLRQAEKSAVIGRLGSAIAHEIRNPLNYINLTLDHLRSKFAPDDQEKIATFTKLISQIKSEVARINQQISDFLNYSRPANVNLRPVEARQVVEDSLRLVEAHASENDIRIAVVEYENVPKILADPEFLRSVFNNLFINAVQAMGNEGGNLSVKIAPDGDFVCYEISDTGSGISDDNLSKIFEPYFSTKETGTGLGLAIVQKIVDVHNGTIEVESNEGKGTKFTVRLPTSV